MGTNFYVDDEPTCNNPAHTDRLHLGKRSAGWKFGFQGYPERGLTSWEAWRALIGNKPIIDEYGREYTLEEFAKEVLGGLNMPLGLPTPICHVNPTPAMIRQGFGGRFDESPDVYHDPEGFDFSNREFS